MSDWDHLSKATSLFGTMLRLLIVASLLVPFAVWKIVDLIKWLFSDGV